MKKFIVLISVLVCSISQANTQPIWTDFVKPGSVVVVKSERTLYYVDFDKILYPYPIAIGKPKTPSPSGEYVIERKAKNPTWYPSDTIRYENPNHILPAIVPPGPQNPLGPRAIYLAGIMFRIHGTNKPSSIGKAVSHGCIRMKNEHIIDLYNKVDIGTPVYIFK